MSNPYVGPTVVGYNATPPANDGSEVSANQLDWDKHLDKIGNPLKTFMEAVDTAVLAAFGLEFGVAVLSKSGDYTVTTADRGRFISVTGTTTITLLAAADAGSGFPLVIVNTGTGVVTVDGDSSETINGATTVTLNPGTGLLISSNGAAWFGTVSPGNDSGTFAADWVGFSAAQQTTWHYTRVGSVVNMRPFGTLNAASNATGFASAAGDVPATLRPTASTVTQTFVITDNGVQAVGVISISSAGTISFTSDVANNSFTPSGLKGFIGGASFTYNID